MTWSENTVIRILLFVAALLSDDAAIALEIKNLSSHIAVHAPEAPK